MSEAVSITLDTGARFGVWTELELVRTLDGYTALSLSGPFDFERPEVRRAFQPLMFERVTVRVGDELVLTGRIRDVAPDVTPEASSIGVTAYSLAYYLTEQTPAPIVFPLEFNGFDLRQIAYRLVGPVIGEAPLFDGPVGAAFARVRCEPDTEIHGFLVELALQRGFVLTDAPSGELLFRSARRPGSPVARLTGQPVNRVTAAFDPGNWFGILTGRASRKSGRAGSSYISYNPLYRPFQHRITAVRLSDTESADVPAAMQHEIGRMVGSVVKYTIEDLPSWRDPSGALWRPNETITVIAPEAMIYTETELLIRSVRMKQTPEADTATLELVLPGAFGGPLPKELPWEGF